MKKIILKSTVLLFAFSMMSFSKLAEHEEPSMFSKFWGHTVVFHDSYDPETGCITHYADYHYYAFWVNYDNLNNVVLSVEC